MIRKNSIRKSIVEVESAENLEQLKEALLIVLKVIDEECQIGEKQKK